MSYGDSEEKDIYASYNHERYVHYRDEPTGNFKEQIVKHKSGKVTTRMTPILVKKKIPFDEIKKINLDSYGKPLPQMDQGDVTLVANYLLDFWGAAIGNDPVSLYIHLKRYAYGKKDYCYPDIELLMLKMKKSRNHIKDCIKILEENHFIVAFNRLDTEEERNVSPFFKIKRYIPFISKDMYENLDPRLQKLHDDYLEQYEGMKLNNELEYKDPVTKNLTLHAEIIANKELRQQLQIAIDLGNKKDYILNSIKSDEVLFQQHKQALYIHDYISLKVSKPVYDTYFKDSIFIMTKNSLILACSSDFVKERIECQYTEQLSDAINSIHEEEVNNPPINIEVILYDEFIHRYLKQ